MLEDLTNMTFSPTVIGFFVAVAVCFVAGRFTASVGARQREEELKRELLEVKAAIPRLESKVRNRDQQIVRMEEEISDLNDRTAESLNAQEEKSKALRRAEREVKNLTSELNAVRGNRQDDNSIIMDGFEDEAAGESEESRERAQLKRLEGLYEKLKAALIQRDARIEVLEAEGAAASDPAPPALEPAHEPAADADSSPLEQKISAQAATIEALQNQLNEIKQDKEMLEDLAQRRSKSNRALKDATAEMEARVPELEQDIATRDQTIAARESSIKRLLDEAEQARKDIAARDSRIEMLNAEAESAAASLAANSEQQATLQTTIDAREARIKELDTALNAANNETSKLTGELKHAHQLLSEQDVIIEQKDQVAKQQDLTRETLERTLRERDAMITTLQADVSRGEQALTASSEQQQTLQATLNGRDERITVLDNELVSSRGEAGRLQAELSAAQKKITEQEQAIERADADSREHTRTHDALRSTLRDRELQIEHLSKGNASLETQLVQARDEATTALQALDRARQQAEVVETLAEKRQQAVDSERDASDRRADAWKREIEDLRSSLAQHEQWMGRLKKTLEERESRSREHQQTIARLQSELETANGKLATRYEEQTTLEESRHQLDREITTLTARIEQAEAELAEKAQAISVYRNTLADKDLLIEALQQEQQTEPAVEAAGEAPMAIEPIDAGGQDAVPEPEAPVGEAARSEHALVEEAAVGGMAATNELVAVADSTASSGAADDPVAEPATDTDGTAAGMAATEGEEAAPSMAAPVALPVAVPEGEAATANDWAVATGEADAGDDPVASPAEPSPADLFAATNVPAAADYSSAYDDLTDQGPAAESAPDSEPASDPMLDQREEATAEDAEEYTDGIPPTQNVPGWPPFDPAVNPATRH